MKQNNPLVSVLMTSYNRELYIADAIESVLSSTYQNFELLIFDDASTDATVAIANKFAKQDDRIKIFVNEYNLTQFPNRNKAASFAKGKYIKYVDSDDTIYSWTIDYCIEMMEQYPEAGMGIIYLQNIIQQDYLLPSETIHLNFFKSTILNIGPVGTILRAEAFKAAGYYDSEYGVPSDMYFNLKMANIYPIVLLKRDFFFYRKHDGQELNNRYSYLQFNYKYLFDAFNIPNFSLNQQQKNYLLNRQRYWYVKDFFVYLKNNGNFKKAFKAAKHSGMGIKNFIMGIYHLLFIKLKLKKDF